MHLSPALSSATFLQISYFSISVLFLQLQIATNWWQRCFVGDLNNSNMFILRMYMKNLSNGSVMLSPHFPKSFPANGFCVCQLDKFVSRNAFRYNYLFWSQIVNLILKASKLLLYMVIYPNYTRWWQAGLELKAEYDNGLWVFKHVCGSDMLEAK